jgi:hypothetical protein
MATSELMASFGMHDGQFFAHYRHKNQILFMNGERFGFGDLRDEDIDSIKEKMNHGDVFEAHNEHHGSRTQQHRCKTLTIHKTAEGELIVEGASECERQ